MSRIFRDSSFQIAFFITLIFLGVGFVFLHFGLVGYGWFFFLILPVVLGISLGALPKRQHVLIGSAIAGCLLMVFLLVAGFEGFICILMTLPLLIPLVFLGAVISFLVKRYNDLKSVDSIPVLLLPLLPFLFGGIVEKALVGHDKRIIDVRSEIILPYTPEQVYDGIKSMDTVIAPKGTLMKIDLPVPRKCILEKEAVGGVRTCYFDGGKISEKITALQRGQLLKMDVTSYQLTGRKWLGFKEAIYTFEKMAGNQCRLTRITTYTSELRPRFYWEPLERWGIEEEHEYVFTALKKKLDHL